MTIISRAQWGARAAKRVTRIAGPVQGVAGHYEGVTLGQYSAESVPARIRSIQQFHMDKNGWDDIAYSFVVDRFGRVYAGRGPGVRTAANGTNHANDHFYAGCILMGPDDELTDEAKAGWLEGREWLRRQGGAGEETPPHSALFATQCPGDRARAWFSNHVPAPALWTPDPVVVTPAGFTPDMTEIAHTNFPGTNPDIYSVEAEVAQLPTVQQGSNGQHVKICQGLLVANGRTVDVDGVFGPRTTSALTEWQGAVKITPDGVCGPQTWRRLLCI